MKLLFYIANGIIYGLCIFALILGFMTVLYGLFKFLFWIFDVFEIANPFITAYDWVTGRSNNETH